MRPSRRSRARSRSALLNLLRALAADGPLVIAIDDVPWLDVQSAEALAFAARRLAGEPIAFLLARRPGRGSMLERALEPMRLQIGPLSLGATRRLLAERLELSLPRPLLRHIVDTTLGNPLFALEVGRMLAEQGLPASGEEIGVPDAVEELLSMRVDQLGGSAAPGAARGRAERRAARSTSVSAIEDGEALEDALDRGLVRLDGDRVRAAHPLLAAAARKRATAPGAPRAAPRAGRRGGRRGAARAPPRTRDGPARRGRRRRGRRRARPSRPPAAAGRTPCCSASTRCG